MPALTQRAGAVRDILVETVRGYGETPICFSGGIDSASVLAASLALGYRPRLLAFQLGRFVSRDLQVARDMAECFGLKLEVARVPRNLERLVADLRRLLPIAAAYLHRAYEGNRTYVKVPIQCLHPMSYVAELAAETGVTRAFSGFCADTYYGSGRAANTILHEQGFAAWQAYRVMYLLHPVNADMLVKHYFAMLGIDLVDAWASAAMQDLMFGMGPAELNRPFAKALSVYAFPEFWRCGAWLRGNESLQVAGGIRDFHDELLTSRFNRTGAKTVVALYAAIANEKAPAATAGA